MVLYISANRDYIYTSRAINAGIFLQKWVLRVVAVLLRRLMADRATPLTFEKREAWHPGMREERMDGQPDRLTGDR